MISITNLFSKSNRVTIGNQVSLIHRGRAYIGTVNRCDYKANKYIVSFIDINLHSFTVERPRHRINPVEDVEYEEVVNDCMQLSAAYQVEDFVHLEMM